MEVKKFANYIFQKKFRKLHNESNHAGIAKRMISYYLDHRDFKAIALRPFRRIDRRRSKNMVSVKKHQGNI